MRPMRKNFSRRFLRSASTGGRFWRDDENHADTHVEGLQQFVGVDFAELARYLKIAGNGQVARSISASSHWEEHGEDCQGCRHR